VRFRDLEPRERWGYFVWGAVGAVVAIPEIWASVWKGGPWPTISATIGHLELLWSPTAVVVVAVIVVVAANAITSRGQLGERPTRRSEATAAVERTGAWGSVYLVGAILVVLVPSVLVALFFRGTTEHTKWILGYVIYGLIAVFCVVLPSALAYWLGKEVPFPTLLRTIAYLEDRVHVAAVVILAGLVVLLIHLAFFPWPDIAHILQEKPLRPTSP
jgi:hypothetical protein